MITRVPNLSEMIRSVVRQMIVNGELAPDSRINEIHLSEQLQVSRTPLREALMGLVAEGALISIARRGFFVRPLSVEEFRHIYPIRAILDPEALKLAGLPSKKRLTTLKRLNGRMAKEAEVEARIRLDDRWHLELIAECPNPVLLDLIRQFMMRTRRYELAFFRDERNLRAAMHDHSRVISAAEEGDLDGAVESLKINMTIGIEPILKWLAERKHVTEHETNRKRKT